MKLSDKLLKQLIELEEARDGEWKKLMMLLHKSSQTIGDSAILTHLRLLKELLEKGL